MDEVLSRTDGEMASLGSVLEEFTPIEGELKRRMEAGNAIL
jgi:hypothetical protein